MDTQYHLQRRQAQAAGDRADERIVRLGTLVRKADTRAQRIPRPIALLGLVAAAAGIMYASNLLVSVTQDLTTGTRPFAIGSLNLATIHLSQTFVGLVVIPIIGSFAENINSIRAAVRGRAEEAVASSAGSAIQIALIAV